MTTTQDAFRRVRTRTLSRARSALGANFWFAPMHGAPVRLLAVSRLRQQDRKTFFRLGLATVFRCAAGIRPTDFCHHFHLTTCTRALGSPFPDPIDLRRRGETGGADASRRPSSLRPDSSQQPEEFSSLDANTIKPLTPLSPARSFVPPFQATTRCSFEPRPRAPYPREGIRGRDDPRCLPSVGRSSYRTFAQSPRPSPARERPHHVKLAAGWVWVSVVLSFEAPSPMPFDTDLRMVTSN